MAETFYSKIRGVKFNNADGSSRQAIIKDEVQKGDVLFLRVESDGEFAGAIQVLSIRKKQIGYLSKEIADKYRGLFDLSEADDPDTYPIQVYVKDVTGSDPVGVNIVIEELDDFEADEYYQDAAPPVKAPLAQSSEYVFFPLWLKLVFIAIPTVWIMALFF